ncbi:hypothetical protein BD779DRAFT_1784896 [Infundibulicybe gibba]|nr:hypothetical protein BD779DRAFT_1784896 [Infundibulicybe gibba]
MAVRQWPRVWQLTVSWIATARFNRWYPILSGSTSQSIHASSIRQSPKVEQRCQFPPVAAAASVLLLIFKTIQGVQNNKVAYLQLARRCARILLDINEQMEGRWNTAPPSLLKNLEKFERTLNSIHTSMKEGVEVKWGNRFLRKVSIENALMDYHSQLDDAWQSFQVCIPSDLAIRAKNQEFYVKVVTLINIHHAISSGSPGSSRLSQGGSPSQQGTAPPLYIKPIEANKTLGSDSPVEAGGFAPDKPQSNGSDSGNDSNAMVLSNKRDIDIAADDTLEDRGFRRYHQSEVRLMGRAPVRDGWWGGSSLAEADGRKVLAKRYEGPQAQAARLWLHDIKILQDLYHPNLPQLAGYSQSGAPTPFILLSNIQLRVPQALLNHVLHTTGIASCAHLVLRFYNDITDATIYLQQQLNLDVTKAQDFLERASYHINGSNMVIVGLPKPRDGVWYTIRNYGLAESLKRVVINILPNTGPIQLGHSNAGLGSVNGKLKHIISLCHGLLPDEDPPTFSPRVRRLMENEESAHANPQEIPMDLRQIRLSNIEAGVHNYAWYEASVVSADQFFVGDFGYIPKGEKFGQFKRLGNIFKDELANFPIEYRASGTQWCQRDGPGRREPIEPYDLPGGAKYWPIAVSPSDEITCQVLHEAGISRVDDAWGFLLKNGFALSCEFGISPEEIILITNAGCDQYSSIFNINRRHSRNGPPMLGRPPVGHQASGFSHWNQQPQFGRHGLPVIMYLLTSIDSQFRLHWLRRLPVGSVEDSSMCHIGDGWVDKAGWSNSFVHWIQLHPEDFLD